MRNHHVRWMIPRDLPEALQIEHDSFVEPWTEANWREHLRLRDYIGMVAERDERVLGIMIYRLEKRRITLVRLAVDAGLRKQGVGRALIGKLMGKVEFHGRRTRVAFEVCETNTPCHLFLKAVGFEAVRVVRGDEGDAYRFVYRAMRPASLVEVEF